VDPVTHLWLGRLRAAGAPTPEERLELLELPAEQRRSTLTARVHARAVAVLRELGVPEAELTALAALPPERFRHAARELVHTQLAPR